MADQGALKQIIQKIKDSNNVLVTVNTNPTVDELSAALAITLCMNKLNKHATAVFSGNVPPAIEFLNPEKTFENTVDSLRDFIIALDKEKADHLRYKVVDDMVKIFITPYRTTINQNDLEFSQGDYNVEFVLAVGVQSEADLDHALASHGRILHDATVATVSINDSSKLGGIEWSDRSASSYSEMLYLLAEGIKNDKSLLDEQVANAFLTGIVAATERFSNSKTSSKVMTIAAQLMSAGANQQLVATKLEEYTPEETDETNNNDSSNGTSSRDDQPQDIPEQESPKDAVGADGSLSISHMPEGTVDEVSKELAEIKSQQALDHAEDQLTKHTDQQNGGNYHDTAKAAEEELARHVERPRNELENNTIAESAEDKLAAQLAAAAPPQPKMFDTPVPHPLQDMVDEKPQVQAEEPMEQPSMGGTLNATTEQAAEDSRRAIDADRNRTILSHGGTYSSAAPSYQSPLNAAASGVDVEPSVRDVLSEGNETAPTGKAVDIQPLAPVEAPVAEIQPPAPLAPAPTLAEIDAQNRSAHNDARAAIDAALSTQSVQQPEPLGPMPSLDSSATDGTDLPPLPPLPPLPDFSTLPPLPGDSSLNSSPVLDTLGATFPPAPEAPAPQPADPSQFKIPGQ